MFRFLTPICITIIKVGLLALLFNLTARPAHADYIRNANNMGLCMAVLSGNNGSPIIMQECHTNFFKSQQWSYDRRSGLIESIGFPGKCIHKAAGGWNNGNKLHLWDCDAGSAEMKIWRFDLFNGIISGADNPGFCMHTDLQLSGDASALKIWNACSPGLANASWRLTNFEQTECSVFNYLVAPNTENIREMVDNLLPITQTVSRRKQITISDVGAVSSNGCDASITLKGMMRRKWRRDAHGSFTMTAKLHSMSGAYICMRDLRLNDADLSNTGAIGEYAYELAGSLSFPRELCVAF